MNIVTAYLDERGTEEEDFYYIGGLTCSSAAAAPLAEWMRGFKRRVRPGQDPNRWYAKGSGEWLDEHGKHKEGRDEAFARWELFAEELRTLTINYTIHACIVRRERLMSRFASEDATTAKLKRAVLRAALVPTFLGIQLTGADAAELYIDRIEDAQADAFSWSFEIVNRLLAEDDLTFRLTKAVNVSKEDFASDTAQILQLVDAQAYAISRFVEPSGKLAHILANFEKWPYVFDRLGVDIPDTSENRQLMNRFYKIVPLYHHLASHVKANYLSKHGKASTFALLGAENHFNFGADFVAAVWCLSGPIWNQSGADVGMDVSQYP